MELKDMQGVRERSGDNLFVAALGGCLAQPLLQLSLLGGESHLVGFVVGKALCLGLFPRLLNLLVTSSTVSSEKGKLSGSRSRVFQKSL